MRLGGMGGWVHGWVGTDRGRTRTTHQNIKTNPTHYYSLTHSSYPQSNPIQYNSIQFQSNPQSSQGPQALIERAAPALAASYVLARAAPKAFVMASSGENERERNQERGVVVVMNVHLDTKKACTTAHRR